LQAAEVAFSEERRRLQAVQVQQEQAALKELRTEMGDLLAKLSIAEQRAHNSEQLRAESEQRALASNQQAAANELLAQQSERRALESERRAARDADAASQLALVPTSTLDSSM